MSGHATRANEAGDRRGGGRGRTGGALDTLSLPPGHYELVCNHPGHYRAGVFAELDVI